MANLDHLEGKSCPNCGLTYPGPDYDGEAGFCVAPWQGKGDPGGVACLRLSVERLRKENASLVAGNRQLSSLVEHGNKVQTALFRVATEAAAMLAETRHGGLMHARSESLGAALKAAGVAIPGQCSACPHGRDGD